MYDILIVGGGPAGLTAALYCRRAGKSVLLCEREVLGGQIVYSPMVDNYPAAPHISGAAFASRLSEQVEELGAQIEYALVESVEKTAQGFVLHTDAGDFEGKALILATGVRHRKLGLPGEEDLVGCGVSYCAVCDGAFYQGREVAVVGGGDTAVADALFLAGICKKVTLIHRRDAFRAEAALVAKLYETENIELCLDAVVSALHEENGELTIIDYKTDRVRGEALSERAEVYAGQVRAYAIAAKRITGKPVKECVLYFLDAGEEVVIKM